MNPIDALSALTQSQLPDANALGGGALNGALGSALNGALANGGAINANPLPGAVPIGLTAPVSEGFGPMLTSMQSAAPLTNTVASTGGSGPSTWGHLVQQMVMDANSKQSDANALVTDVLKGGPTPVHQAMIATEEASLSFEFLAEARNKVLDAYNQVMQMQV